MGEEGVREGCGGEGGSVGIAEVCGGGDQG